MFSYRHGFHAGNHADVLKHTILIAALQHMAQKDTAISVMLCSTGSVRIAKVKTSLFGTH